LRWKSGSAARSFEPNTRAVVVKGDRLVRREMLGEAFADWLGEWKSKKNDEVSRAGSDNIKDADRKEGGLDGEQKSECFIARSFG